MFCKHAGGLHPAIELFAFAAALADPAENAHPFLMPDHVVDHLGEQHRLADARAAEQARLAAALQRHEHIDGLDARLENLGFGGTLGQRRAARDERFATCTSDGSGWRSMARPNTSNIREMIFLPTGACRGPPVSSTGIPRAKPCVGVKAMPRTRRASSCAITSMTISLSAPARSTE